MDSTVSCLFAPFHYVEHVSVLLQQQPDWGPILRSLIPKHRLCLNYLKHNGALVVTCLNFSNTNILPSSSNFLWKNKKTKQCLPNLLHSIASKFDPYATLFVTSLRRFRETNFHSYNLVAKFCELWLIMIITITNQVYLLCLRTAARPLCWHTYGYKYKRARG